MIKIIKTPLSHRVRKGGYLTFSIEPREVYSPEYERKLKAMAKIPYPQSTHSGKIVNKK